MSDGITMTWRQYRLERRMFWRNPTAAFFNFLLPLLFLGLFGAVFSSDQDNLDVIVPGIAGMSIMATTFHSLAMSLTSLREQGVLKRIRGTPLSESAYLGGVFGSAIANAAILVGVVVVSGKLFFGIGWPADWAQLALFTIAGVVCFASLGVAYSHVIPNVDAAPAFTNLVFLPAIFISGVFYDVNDAPAFLHDIARALPLTHVINGISDAMLSGHANAGALAVIAVWTVFGVVFAVRGFSWDQKRA